MYVMLAKLETDGAKHPHSSYKVTLFYPLKHLFTSRTKQIDARDRSSDHPSVGGGGFQKSKKTVVEGEVAGCG